MRFESQERRLDGSAAIRIILVVVLAVLRAGAVPPPGPVSIDISPRAISRNLQKVESQTDLPDEVRKQIVAKYKEALNASRQAEFYAAETLRHQHANAQYKNHLEKARKELRSIEAQGPRLRTVSGSTEYVKQELALAQANLQVLRQAQTDIETSSRLRSQRRTEIANRIAIVNQQLLRFDEAGGASNVSVETSAGHAAYSAALATRKAAENEVEALRAELETYNNNAELPPVRRDLAERRVAAASQSVQELEADLAKRTVADAEALRTRIQLECAEAVKLFPSLRPLAEEVVEYVNLLASPKGVQVEADSSRLNIAIARTDLAQFRRILRGTERRFLAPGLHRDASQWFPEIPATMPMIAALKDRLHEREARISEIEHEIAVLENTRNKQGDLETEAEALPARLGIPGSSVTASFESHVRHLLYTRRDLQGGLVAAYSHTLSGLQELDSLERLLLAEEEQLVEYVRERIFWVKNFWGPVLPPWSELRAAAVWLITKPEWAATFANARAKVAINPFVYIGAIVAIAILLAFRRRVGRALVASVMGAGDRFTPTLRAVAFTFLLALPFPACLLGIGWLIMTTAQTPAAVDIGSGLIEVSLIAFVVGFAIAMTRKRGLAEEHFNWHTETSRQVHSVLRLALFPILITVFLHLAFGTDVTHYIGPLEQATAANSLGRLAFMLAVACASFTSWKLLRPRRAVVDAMTVYSAGHHRHRPLLLWLPLFYGVSLLVTILAAYGYYFTALIVMRRATMTVLVACPIVLIAALIAQWRTAKRKRLTVLHAGDAFGEEEDRREPDAEALALQLADDQLMRLSQFVTSAVMLTCAFFIWSDLLPSLRILERITLLPSIGVITDKEVATGTAPVLSDATPTAPPGEKTAEKTKESPPSGFSPVSALKPPPPKAPPEGERIGSSGDGSIISLANLLTAIVIIVVTILLAKDIPGPLQFILRRPLPHSGDRNAVATIVKYLILLIGLSAAARQFGLRWSQIQWLAAAFSFGIAFGLQEIFANFVSGIIILVERPMAIGDFCRFGTQTGTVEAIGLRSTQVRAVDRTVIIVPNADFSKKEVVNYTRRDRLLIQTTLALRLETTEQQLRTILERLKELLLKHPKVLRDPARVRFAGLGSYSLNVDLFAYVDSSNWEEFLQIQEGILFRIVEIVREAGTDLAMPSQTTYLTRDPSRTAKQSAVAN